MRGEETLKFFTNEEYLAFFRELERRSKNAKTEFKKKCTYRNEAMFKTLYYCALRATETSMQKVENYNDINKEIYCRRIKGGKNNTLKIIDTDVLDSILLHIKVNQPDGPLFQNFTTHKALSRKTIFYIFKKTCMEANIKDKDKWHPHTLRHTRAIHLAEDGLELKELQYWLGHKHVENTLIYFQFTSKQQEVMYKKLKKSVKKKRGRKDE